jgi:protein-tyrosine phosphatase
VSGRPRRVLVVCTANLCRSTMAERLIRARLEAEGLSDRVVVLSAGTWAREGLASPPHVVAVLAERGIDASDHRSQEVKSGLVEAAELILVMEEGHRTAIELEFPAARGRTRLFSTLGGGLWDIADPIGGELADYRATIEELLDLIHAGWDEITGRGGSAVEPSAGA